MDSRADMTLASMSKHGVMHIEDIMKGTSSEAPWHAESHIFSNLILRGDL